MAEEEEMQVDVDGAGENGGAMLADPAPRTRLLSVKMENFKSFNGPVLFEPSPNASAFYGTPGSGKSNLVDAFRFVLGESTSRLGVADLRELIHRAQDGHAVSDRTYVTAEFRKPDDANIQFTRLVTGSTSEYKINDQIVDGQNYVTALKDMNINPKAKDMFLLTHDTVQFIANMNPKERAAFLEDISGSAELKDDYDRLEIEAIQAEKDAQFSLQKRRATAAEKRQAKKEKENAATYEILKEKLAQLESQCNLFKIHCCEDGLMKLKEDLRLENLEAQKADEKIRDVEVELAQCKMQRDQEDLALADAEEEFPVVELDTLKKREQNMKSRLATACQRKRLETAKSFEKLSEAENDLHEEDMRRLGTEMQEAIDDRQEFEEALQARARNILLSDSQIAVYDGLKEEAMVACLGYEAELKVAMGNKDRLEDELHKKITEERLLNMKEAEIKEANRRLERVEERINKNTIALQGLKDRESKMVDTKKRIKEIEDRLEVVTKELLEESSRRKKADAIKRFKKLSSGVYGYVADLCNPVEERYEKAVSAVLKDKMESIVVDTVETAKACGRSARVAYTFIPLDFMATVKPGRRLRGTKWFSDIVEFEPSMVKSAVLSTAAEVVVCKTPEDAKRVAFNYGDGRRYAAVSLDGTYYQKHGIVSRGTAYRAERLRRLDEATCLELEKEKLQLTEELKNLKKATLERSKMKRVELAMARQQSKKSNTLARIDILQKEIGELTENQRNNAEEELKNAELEVKNIQKKINTVEDEVFTAFCQEIGVDNIRQYEESEVLELPKLVKQKFKLDNQILDLEKHLEYMRSKNTAANLLQCRDDVKTIEKELEKCQHVENRQTKEMDEAMTRLETAERNLVEKKMRVMACQHKVKEFHKKMLSVTEELQTAKKGVTALVIGIESKKADRKRLLDACKTDNITIPLLRGSLEDPEYDIEIDYSGLAVEMQSHQSEDQVKIIMEKFNEDIQDLKSRMERIGKPNVKAAHCLRGVRNRYVDKAEDYKEALVKAQQTKEAFEAVRDLRGERFSDLLRYVSDNVDGTYKRLMRDQGARAILVRDGSGEPYLDGLKYSFAPPGKSLQPIGNVLGAEKTMAALALILTIHSFQPAVFFVLDMVHLSLDDANTQRVESFIEDNAINAFQRIVITSNKELFHNVDSSFGIQLNAPEPSSSILHLDLSQYQ